MNKHAKNVVLLNKPDPKSIDEFIASLSEKSFSYEEVGNTARMNDHRHALVKNYRIAHFRFPLGHGAETYERAKRALRQWKSFDLKWVHFCWPEFEPKPGLDMAIMGHNLGLWMINAVRVVEVYEEVAPVHRYGFIMGTLPDHMIVGEERMQVEWHPEDDTVWYELLSFSRKRRWLSKFGAFHVHRMQRRFALESGQAMNKAVYHLALQTVA